MIMVVGGLILIAVGLIVATGMVISARPVGGATALSIVAVVIGVASVVAALMMGTASGSEAAAAMILFFFVGPAHIMLGIVFGCIATCNRRRRQRHEVELALVARVRGDVGGVRREHCDPT